MVNLEIIEAMFILINLFCLPDVRISDVNAGSASHCQPNCDKHTLQRLFPITKWLPKYTLTWFIKDFIAGVTVGLTAIPQGIAYAVVSGLDPKVTLFTQIGFL